MTKVIWHSDKSKKRGTIRIVLIRATPDEKSQSPPLTFRIEERIRDNALGEETWVPFDHERLPSWVIGLISEFVYEKE